jgi:putative two-component system response regulator
MGLKVLIVDDDFINRTLLKSVLKKNSSVSTMIEAENGQDALEKVTADTTIDIILLDIIMPVLDGVEFLKVFRTNPKFDHIPVIVLSTDDTRKGEVMDLGANDFHRKPIKEEVLFKKIDQWTV